MIDLESLPWRWIGIAAAVLSVFIGGCEFGESRVQSAWNQEKAAQQEAVAKQAVKVAEHANASQSINMGVSDYVQARRSSIGAVNFAGLRQPSGNSALPGVSGGTAGIAASTESCVSTADYNRLAADAADDAVIVLAWQKWYDNQCDNFGGDYCKNQPE